jgi:hypothetical protein
MNECIPDLFTIEPKSFPCFCIVKCIGFEA